MVCLMALGLAGMALVGITGCGGSGGSGGGSSPQTYVLTVQASSGSLSHTLSINLTVE